MEAYSYILTIFIGAFVLVFWKAAQWAMSSARAAREAESLTPSDFEALKEACETLIADMRSTADDCTARVEVAIRKAENAIKGLNNSNELKADIRPAAPLFHLPIDDIPVPEFTLPADNTDIDQTSVVAQSKHNVFTDMSDSASAGSVERIYQLADSGMSCEEIAQVEDRSPAEVKLFLDVREMQVRLTQAA